MTKLKERKCSACRGDTPLLSDEAVAAYLEQLPRWAVYHGMLRKTFTFGDFRCAAAFVGRVAEIADGENHHPDITITPWKRVTVSFTTYAVHGLTENDAIMAARVEAIAAADAG